MVALCGGRGASCSLAVEQPPPKPIALTPTVAPRKSLRLDLWLISGISLCLLTFGLPVKGERHRQHFSSGEGAGWCMTQARMRAPQKQKAVGLKIETSATNPQPIDSLWVMRNWLCLAIFCSSSVRPVSAVPPLQNSECVKCLRWAPRAWPAGLPAATQNEDRQEWRVLSRQYVARAPMWRTPSGRGSGGDMSPPVLACPLSVSREPDLR